MRLFVKAVHKYGFIVPTVFNIGGSLKYEEVRQYEATSTDTQIEEDWRARGDVVLSQVFGLGGAAARATSSSTI